MPFPSKGCTTCRRRKVKCDGTRPYCRVCERVKRECLGYDTEPSGFVFKSAPLTKSNPSGTTTLKRRSPNNVLSDAQANSVKASAAASNVLSTPDSRVTRLPPPVQPSVQEQAMSFYWTHYLGGIYISKPVTGIRAHIQMELLKSCASDEPVFTQAIAAESMLMYGKLCKCLQSLELARESYSEAIRETKTSVSCLSRACSDKFLLAVMIFSSYEIKLDTARDPRSRARKAEGFVHQIGAMSLMKLRQDPRCGTGLDRSIDRSVRQQVLRSCVLRAYPIPDWLRDGSQFGEAAEELCLDRHLVEVVDLRCRTGPVLRQLRSLAFDRENFRQAFYVLLEMALRLDKGLEECGNMLTQTYNFTKLQYDAVNRISQVRELVINGTIHIYPGSKSGHLWNTYRAARLVCNSIIIALNVFNNFDNRLALKVVMERSRSTLTELVDAVSESVSFYFLNLATVTDQAGRSHTAVIDLNLESSIHRTDALVFVLIVTLNVFGLNPARRRWIRDKLSKVATSMGSGTLQMLVCCERHEGDNV